ncbi:MAG: hypothetical protein ACRCZM_06115 [Bacteroidales bacterium]
MKQVRDDLSKKQIKELADYQSSPAGILASANFNGMPDMTFTNLKVTGEWNSKTTEDYLEMCHVKIQQSDTIKNDISILADAWRESVMKEVGRNRYDELSEKIGGDLAYAYVGTRMEDLMINKLIKDNMPKSSADYIIRKAAQTTIWGLSNELMKSPLTREIEEQGEKAYNPSTNEKAAGTIVGSVVDAVSLGGMGSWKALATFVGSDLAINYVINKEKGNDLDRKKQAMEISISKGLFNSDENLFAVFRKQSKGIDAYNENYITNLNSRLSKQMFIPNPKYNPMSWNSPQSYSFNTTDIQTKGNKGESKHMNIPLVVAPGKEDEFLEENARREAEKNKIDLTILQVEGTTEQRKAESTPQAIHTNSNSWGELLSSTGLNGLKDVGNNLGYTLAMLPDVLVGMFTGKTKSLNMKNTMIPIAAIFAGLFIKNPILKWALIGLGGLNLINRGGHEALSWNKDENNTVQKEQSPKYRTYADELLNPRITDPILKGNSLIATIDKVPYTIQLTDTVANAYHAGALPLNTLANAILEKNDKISPLYGRNDYQQIIEKNYGESENETIHRTRGVQ